MKEAIQSCMNLCDQHLEALLDTGIRKKADKESIICRPGIRHNKLIFLESGIMRGYRTIEGKEFTHHFFMPQWFVTDFTSFLTGDRSELTIQALESVEYIEFRKDNLLELYEKYPTLEKLGRIIAEKAYLIMAERLVDLQTTTLKERYLRLLNRSPQLLLQVPQKFIASYLGVTEQSLSRIKANVDFLPNVNVQGENNSSL